MMLIAAELPNNKGLVVFLVSTIRGLHDQRIKPQGD